MPVNVPPFAFTVLTLGVADVARGAAFYAALGLRRKFKATGDEVAFFETGATVLALYRADRLAADAGLPAEAGQGAFRGVTLAWNCNARAEVDAVMDHALRVGARLVKPAHETSYGGYCGFFADPDGHVWEAVQAPGISVAADGRLLLPD